MKTLELFCKCYIILWLSFCIGGCALTDFLLGRDSGTILKELDLNNDGKVTKDEVRQSKYDLDKDGFLSREEMKAAMAPNETTDGLLALMTMLNVPFAGVATYSLKQARKHRDHVKGLIVAGEQLKDIVSSGRSLNRLMIKNIYQDAKEAYSKDGKHLTAIYLDVKAKIKNGTLS